MSSPAGPPYDEFRAAAEDPGAAIRERATAARQHPGDLHDPAAVEAAYLVSAQVLQL